MRIYIKTLDDKINYELSDINDFQQFADLINAELESNCKFLHIIDDQGNHYMIQKDKIEYISMDKK